MIMLRNVSIYSPATFLFKNFSLKRENITIISSFYMLLLSLFFKFIVFSCNLNPFQKRMLEIKSECETRFEMHPVDVTNFVC
jgi:hypothetical protein